MFKPSIHLVVVAAVLLAVASPCRAEPTGRPQGPTLDAKPKSTWATISDSVSSTYKKGVSALSKPFEASTPKTDPSDPTSLSAKADPSAELYVAIARTREEKGLTREAEEHYKKALDVSPDHLGAMLGYGRFLDRQGRIEESLHWYHRAIKAHPRDATPLNHLALCLASHSLLDRAAPYLERAVRLAPNEPVYRNNLAMILVEQGNNEAAFRQLVAVQDEATAYYNLGYLLQKRGDTDAARKHFALALRCNPQFEEARAWLAHFERTNPNPPREPAQLAERPDWATAGQSRPAPSPPLDRGVPSVAPQAMGPPPGNSYVSSPGPINQAAVPQGAARPQGTQPTQIPGLHQPAGATAPVYQTNPLRRDSQWPQPAPRTSPPTSPWFAAPNAPVASLPSGQPAPVATGANQPGVTPSPSVAPLPESRQVPATGAYGTPNTKVVYPLPPVVEAAPTSRR